MNKPTVSAVSVLGTLVLLAAGGLVVVLTGAYDVAATGGHSGITQWILKTAQRHSVSARAASVSGALPTDSASIRHGMEEYHEMCVTCHGAPGVERGNLGKGMTPSPPLLHEHAADWTDRELFWITKHGIKLAGMPAFGVTHDDATLWDIAAFVRQLPETSPAEYAHLVRSLEEDGHAEEHTEEDQHE